MSLIAECEAMVGQGAVWREIPDSFDEFVTSPRHLHLGPLAVDRHLQGKGIGTQILLEHTRRLDEANAIGYLETDKNINVRLYQRFGYEVIGEADVIGVHCWFMRRPPRTA